jgi:hypothetical protein
MEGRDERTDSVKRVVLPSGKTIEVVLLGSGEGEQPPVETERQPSVHPPAEPRQDLHVCESCESELVYPVEWEEAGPDN